jgi:hypothetical protein
MPYYIQELHQGANILLAHFHYCNKGSHPFSLKRSSMASMAELNEDQTQFLVRTAKYFEARSKLDFTSANICESFANNLAYLSRGDVTESEGVRIF